MPDSVRTLRTGFLRSAEKYPEHVALEVDGRAISYLELKGAAASLAATLERHAPTGGPALTAVFGHRSGTAFAGILGALLHGHGYVPLNPGFPEDRTRSMLQRSGCRSVIVDEQALRHAADVLGGIPERLLVVVPDEADVSELAQRLEQHEVVGKGALAPAGDWRPGQVDPDGIAYLLFTSGSTGTPKGVMVAHRNVVPFVDSMVERYTITHEDCFSQTFDLTFDLSVFDLFVAWERGARVCCPTQAQKMLPGKYIRDSGLTVWFSVPSTGALMNRLRMLQPDRYPNLRWSLFCGEALPMEIVEAWAAAAPNSTVENLYGPTELTIACTLYRWDAERSPGECEMGLVPIGEPYPGMDVLVADEELREVAPGETGELLMTGPQLTLGYWKDPDRTAAAFVVPPGKSELHYRTGDRVRRSEGATPMVYLGRIDNQIKIQGYRVELGEVEAVVREEAGVGVAIAVGWPKTASGADGVVAFVAQPGLDTASALKRSSARLPAYMAPREIRCIPQFPLNPNGKVDRRALVQMLEAGPAE